MNSVCHVFLEINIQHPFNNLAERVEIVPEHPWAGVSSESWTSSGCPSLPGWRPHPRPPGCRVGSPWTEQSGRSGCSETAPLQKGNQERGGSAKSQTTRKHTNKRRGLLAFHFYSPHEAGGTPWFVVGVLFPLAPWGIFWIRLVQWETFPLSTAGLCSLLCPQNNPSVGQEGHH